MKILIISGVFTLLGALIAAMPVWYVYRKQQRQAMRAAGRALCLEMYVNCSGLKAFVLTLRSNPNVTLGAGVFPLILRTVFDQHLPTVANLLTFDDLRRVARPYTAGYGPYVMLDAMVSQKPQALDGAGLHIINQTSIMFLDAMDIVKRVVLTPKELEQFENEDLR